MPASLAASCTERVLAVRHSLSAPIWLNPSTSGLEAPSPGGWSLPPEQAEYKGLSAERETVLRRLEGMLG